MSSVEKFPESYRFSVSRRLIDTELDLLLLLVEAAYRKNKRDALRTAGVRTNAFRYLLRLAHGVKLLSGSADAFAARIPGDGERCQLVAQCLGFGEEHRHDQ